jgi:tRNA-dihydrouridine synthase
MAQNCAPGEAPGGTGEGACPTPQKMNHATQLDELLARSEPLLALAPMQDVTDLPFWRLLARYGGPDVYFTEYFRVHPTSHVEKEILRSIVENPTGKPAIAQMIGNDVPSLVRTALELQKHAVAGIDLNLGCPAPVVYRKCAGGGLLREPERVDAILAALRECVTVKFTVKTRIGFDSPAVFDQLIPIFQKHSPDLLTVHARTVHQMYRPVVHYEYVTQAVQTMRCPVLANGNVDSPRTALEVLQATGARGLMIGRGAIRNPWIFDQIRQQWRGMPVFVPRGRDLLAYVHDLYESVKPPNLRLDMHVQKMKKYMNYLAVGIDPEGQFLHEIRRVTTEIDFFKTCERYLDHDREAFPVQAEGSVFGATPPASAIGRAGGVGGIAGTGGAVETTGSVPADGLPAEAFSLAR